MTAEFPDLIDAKFIRLNTDFSHNFVRFLYKLSDFMPYLVDIINQIPEKADLDLVLE